MKLLVESARELPLVQMLVCIPGGGAHDPPNREGLARVVGRMLRRGVEGMSGEQLEARIDRLGAELYIHVGIGHTTVGCEVVSRSAPAAAELLARILATPTFDAEELERLLRQTEAEIVSSRDDDGGLAGRALRRHLFPDHPLGRRVHGTIASLRAITRDEVTAFYRRVFGRDDAIIAIGGDVGSSEAEQLAETLVGGLPAGEPLSPVGGEPRPIAGRRLVVVDKPERSQCKLGIGAIGSHPNDPDYIALLVGNTAFGGAFSSRLMQEVRAKRGWSYGASSSLTTGRVRDAFTLWTAPSSGDAAACLKLELDLLERWGREGIDGDELAFCRDYLRRSFAFEIDTAKKRLGQKLERALLELPDDFHDRFVERVGAVTLDEVNAAIRRRIDPGALRVAAVATDAEIGEALRSAAAWDGTSVEPFDLE